MRDERVGGLANEAPGGGAAAASARRAAAEERERRNELPSAGSRAPLVAVARWRRRRRRPHLQRAVHVLDHGRDAARPAAGIALLLKPPQTEDGAVVVAQQARRPAARPPAPWRRAPQPSRRASLEGAAAGDSISFCSPLRCLVIGRVGAGQHLRERLLGRRP